MYEILVVDDDIKQLSIVGQTLNQEGYDVVKARTAQEALNQAAQEINALLGE